jgi:inner membrane protein
MATLGHVAVGMAAARAYHGRLPRWSLLVGWSALALLPDLDLIGYALGVPYQNPWGHRGATHSLTLAIALGVAIGLSAAWRHQSAGRLALCASVALASHGLLDTLTDGGRGCALLWPIDLTRYLLPWRPIPAAPVGLDLVSPYGAFVALVELAFFSPVFLLALRWGSLRRRPLAVSAFGACWLAAVWLISSGDPVRESIVGFVLRERTLYTDGFSEAAFQSIKEGTSKEDVRRALGEPHGETWAYASKTRPFQAASETSLASLRECRAVRFVNRTVVLAREAESCRAIGIETGTSVDEVRHRLGAPHESCWQYSWSPGSAYRLRMVCFLQDTVDTVIRRWELSE